MNKRTGAGPRADYPSQADEALRRVLNRPAATARPLPTETGARRRALTVRGW